MKAHLIRHVLSVCSRTVMMYLCYFPLVLVAGHYFLEGRTLLLLGLLAGGSFVGILIGLVPMKVYLEVIIALVLSGAGTYAAIGHTPRALVAFGLLYGMIHLGMRSAQYSPEEGLPSRVLALGLVSYLVLPISYRLDPSLQNEARLHLIIGVIAIVATFMMLNRTQLANANLQGRTGPGGVSPDIRLKNGLYAAGLLVLILVTANIGVIYQWLEALRETLSAWLGSLGGQSNELGQDPVPEGPMPLLPIDGEVKERSPFWEALQEIMVFVVSGLVVAVFLVVAGYLAATQLFPLLRKVLARLNREREARLDYLDETEKLEGTDLRAALRKSFGRMKIKRRVLPEDGRERVRLRFAMMLEAAGKDGYKHNPALTPTETAEKLAAAGWRKKPAALLVPLYNRVRYGDGDVAPQELDELERAWDDKSRS